MKANLAVRNTSEYKVISTEETFRLLETSADGLTSSEVRRRVQIFGFNEVAEKRGNPAIAFLSRYWGLDTYSHVAPGLQEAAAESFDKLVSPKYNDAEAVENHY